MDVDRRDFLSAGGLFVCTLAGHRLLRDQPADPAKLSKQLKVPPKVAAAERNGTAYAAQTTLASSGNRVEYWIRAEKAPWQTVPTGRDQMMDEKVGGGRKWFDAYAYRAYSENFGSPLGPATIPGPLIEAEVGQQVVINFQNTLPSPVTVHPHGIFYPEEMDGAYKGKYTDPGGFVQTNQTFQYVWEAHEGTEGTWLYHDHGPIDPVGVFKGLFGTMIIRPAGAPRPDKEFFLVLHSFEPLATGFKKAYSCINGHAYAGNTPTLESNVGDKVAFHVFALDNDFHTFHIHGHRWTDPDGGAIIDNVTLGPADAITAEFTEDNPGRWFYHCHVFSHLHMGMNGWYVVSG